MLSGFGSVCVSIVPVNHSLLCSYDFEIMSYLAHWLNQSAFKNLLSKSSICFPHIFQSPNNVFSCNIVNPFLQMYSWLRHTHQHTRCWCPLVGPRSLFLCASVPSLPVSGAWRTLQPEELPSIPSPSLHAQTLTQRLALIHTSPCGPITCADSKVNAPLIKEKALRPKGLWSPAK